jgi:hypothetical protein
MLFLFVKQNPVNEPTQYAARQRGKPEKPQLLNSPATFNWLRVLTLISQRAFEQA